MTSVVKRMKRWKGDLDHLLSPSETPTKQEAELKDLEGFQTISMVQATGVLSKLLWAEAAELEEIHPKLLQALDTVVLSWLTRLFSIEVQEQCPWVGKVHWTLTSCALQQFAAANQDVNWVDFPIQIKSELLKVDEFGYLGVLLTSNGKRDRKLGSLLGASPASLQASDCSGKEIAGL